MFVYKLSSCGFKSLCSHVNINEEKNLPMKKKIQLDDWTEMYKICR